MCTVTWRVSENGYQILFNRDEQRIRSIAKLPQKFQQDHSIALMPIDPDGQGSWISCNNSGLSLCLLNYYQGAASNIAQKSRGQLIKKFCHSPSKAELLNQFTNLELRNYPPFILVIFDPQQLRQSIEVSSLVWDGKEVKHVEQSSPITSSSIEYPKVQSARFKRYNQIKKKNLTLEQLISYHSSHDPQKGPYSVCMHRDDAHTVSMTTIHVESTSVRMDYHQGSPCQHTTIQSLYQEKKLSLIDCDIKSIT